MLRLASLLAALALPVAATAQTAEEALRLNLGLGVQLCATQLGSEPRITQAFDTAGFTKAGTRIHGSTTVHMYAIPTDAMEVEVTFYGCKIVSRRLGASAGVAAVRDALNTRLPGQFQQYVPNTRGGTLAAPCMGFYNISPSAGPLAISVGADTGGYNPTCVENGTTHVLFEIPG